MSAKSTVGDPIWVESLMTTEEYRETAKRYPSTFTNGPRPVLFDPSIHEGGKWRNRMGAGYTAEEIKTVNDNIDKLFKLLRTKKFENLKSEYQ